MRVADMDFDEAAGVDAVEFLVGGRRAQAAAGFDVRAKLEVVETPGGNSRREQFPTGIPCSLERRP